MNHVYVYYILQANKLKDIMYENESSESEYNPYSSSSEEDETGRRKGRTLYLISLEKERQPVRLPKDPKVSLIRHTAEEIETLMTASAYIDNDSGGSPHPLT